MQNEKEESSDYSLASDDDESEEIDESKGMQHLNRLRNE